LHQSAVVAVSTPNLFIMFFPLDAFIDIAWAHYL
jgi:hypothetical protein